MRAKKRPRFTRAAYAAAAVLERWAVCRTCDGPGDVGGKVCVECVGTGVQRRANPIEIGREGWKIMRSLEDAVAEECGRPAEEKEPDDGL